MLDKLLASLPSDKLLQDNKNSCLVTNRHSFCQLSTFQFSRGILSTNSSTSEIVVTNAKAEL
jgi:hypothetical protein